MPVPLNLTPATAIELGPLPNTLTQEVDFSGTTYTVWYKYTSTFTGVVSIFAFGDLVVYTPLMNTFYPAYPDVYPVGTPLPNVPTQIPVTNGQVYYFEVIPNSGNPAPANLTISGSYPTVTNGIIGSLFINADGNFGGNTNVPAIILSPTTGAVQRFILPFPNGEQGTVLDSGILLYHDVATPSLVLYSSTFTILSTLILTFPDRISVISSDKNHTFYVGQTGAGAIPASVGTFTDAGVYTPNIWTFPIAGLVACAPNPTSTVLYYTGAGGSMNSPIFAWNLITNTALANFAPAQGSGYVTTNDILVLNDGTVINGYYLNGAPGSFFIQHFSTAGAVLNTYLTGTDINSAYSTPRLAYALDDPNSFWVFYHVGTTGEAQISNIQVSTGDILTSITIPSYTGGIYNGPVSATPVLFGPPVSCGLSILRAAVTTSMDGPTGGSPAIPSSGGIYTITSGKTNDTVYLTITPGTPPMFTTEILPIPNPYLIK
jgi:hypothetical protein